MHVIYLLNLMECFRKNGENVPKRQDKVNALMQLIEDDFIENESTNINDESKTIKNEPKTWVFLFCRCGSKTPPAYTRNPGCISSTPLTPSTPSTPKEGKWWKMKNTEKMFFSIFDFYPPEFDRMKLLVHPPESYHQCASFGTLFAIKGFQKRLVFDEILKKTISVFLMFTPHFLIVWPWNLDQTKATVNAHLFCFNVKSKFSGPHA